MCNLALLRLIFPNPKPPLKKGRLVRKAAKSLSQEGYEAIKKYCVFTQKSNLDRNHIRILWVFLDGRVLKPCVFTRLFGSAIEKLCVFSIEKVLESSVSRIFTMFFGVEPNLGKLPGSLGNFPGKFGQSF